MIRKIFEVTVFAIGVAALLQYGLELGLFTTALVYALFIYVLIGNWYVYRRLGLSKPEHLFPYIWKAMSWPTLWSGK